MKIPTVLALDGALGPFSVALLGGSHIATRVAEGNSALERGIALVDELLHETGMRLADVDAIAVGIGPGGFTGLRITLAFAKAFALAAQRPLLGVSSYDVVAECSEIPEDGEPCVFVVRPRAHVYCMRIQDGDDTTYFTGNLAEVTGTLMHYPKLHIAAIPHAGTHDIIASGVHAHTLAHTEVLPALCIARHALRRIETHGLNDLASSHSLRADYGEAPATTLSAAVRTT